MGAPAFTPAELRLVRRLDTPARVQRWLESLPYNHERRGETLRTFRVVRRLRTAHCLEGALSAATILEQHGFEPLLLDLESVDDLDHVLFLWREDGRWGTVAASRDPGLHGRRPLFRTLRELVRSYAAAYVDRTGRIDGYGVFDLRDLRRVDWRLSERNVWAVERALIENDHRAFRMPDREYAHWRERHRRFKERHPDRQPTYYPNRREWL